MGFWRTIYYYLDWIYIGEKEQECVERQKRLKFLMCKQITDGGVKLKPIDKITNFNSIVKFPY